MMKHQENCRVKSENQYHIQYGISVDDVIRAYENDSALTAKVTGIDTKKRGVYLKLGNDVMGYMTWNDSTMYPFTYKYNNIPDQIYAIEGQKVRVKVKRIDPTTGRIFFSRKQNMQEAWEKISEEPKGTIFNASVVSVHKSGLAVYYDIGEGIVALCHLHQYTSTKTNLSKWVNFGDIDKISIHEIEKSTKRITCSRKLPSEESYSSYKKYDILEVRIGEPICDRNKKLTGYFVEIAPNVCGIGDVPHDGRPLKYGEIVKACVRSVKVEKRQMKLSIL